MRRNGLYYIRYSKYLCFEKNLITCESLRIARTINPFMVLVDNIGNGRLQPCVFYNLISPSWVNLYEFHFDPCQFSRLTQNFGRNSHLSNVVDRSRNPDGINGISRKVHLLSDGTGEAGHPPLMTCRVRIPRFYHRGYGLDCSGKAFSQLLRGLDELLFRHLPGRDIFHRSLKIPDRPMVVFCRTGVH